MQAVWTPTKADIEQCNLTWLMRKVGVSGYAQLHRWSVTNRSHFWQTVLERLNIPLAQGYSQFLDTSDGAEHARWLVGARLNIAESCFQGVRERPAIIEQRGENAPITTMTLGQLHVLANRVSNALVQRGVQPGDGVAMALPVTAQSVAAYLGAVQAGAAIIGIADSFSAAEIGTRLRIGKARLVFTQDIVCRAGRTHQLYERVKQAGASTTVVLPQEPDGSPGVTLQSGDVAWHAFLADQVDFSPVPRSPEDVMNILFSSGTTGDPKAIPWTHLCPIKCAMDAHFHQDVQSHDVIAWPTSLGWMMGPWLIFASLINRAAMALYGDAPTQRGFCQFVQKAGVTLLGVVPSLVATWRHDKCLEGIDWRGVRRFSSTGECSNPDDMRWLMLAAGGRPLIEYCGGTEIAGGYITSTLLHPSIPATFTTPTLGIDLVILDSNDRPAERGEVFLVPPSIGLSTRLLNQDHHEIYYAGCPQSPSGQPLRRHGDEMQRSADGTWRAHGRVDDTMNLGGIKVSSAEIERIVTQVAGVKETAAVAEPPPEGGPGQLVIYAVLHDVRSADALLPLMQDQLRSALNPLFKIQRVEVVDALPRTASNKIMRRQLRH